VGHAVAQLVEALSYKLEAAGSVPDGIGFFLFSKPSGRTIIPGSTQPVTETITRIISWGINAAGAYD
jgi:hypothetical protein